MRNSPSYLTVLFSVFFALPVGAEQSLLRDFATCTGRFSAEVEHAWLMETDRAERNALLYANMAALLDSITSSDNAVRARAIRIDAKAAQAQLRLQSVFGWDRDQRVIAEQRADDLLRTCSALLLADAGENTIKIWAVGAE